MGLTQAQVEANPQQADPVALLFNTRKTVNQLQGGIAMEQALPANTTLRVTGYGGRRNIGQYLAFSGVGATSAGGVVNLDRDYGGVGARFIVRGDFSGTPWVFSIGADADRMREKRQGFVNNNGEQGALRRDEDDSVTSGDANAELTWHALRAVSLTLGVRSIAEISAYLQRNTRREWCRSARPSRCR